VFDISYDKILLHGVFVFAGSPQISKSWLILNIMMEIVNFIINKKFANGIIWEKCDR
jgi:hypothetical protein